MGLELESVVLMIDFGHLSTWRDHSICYAEIDLVACFKKQQVISALSTNKYHLILQSINLDKFLKLSLPLLVFYLGTQG